MALCSEIQQCRLCQHTDLGSLVDLGAQASWTLPDPLPLELVQCRACGGVQLRHTVDRHSLFTDYAYRSGMNDWMRAYLIRLAQQLSAYISWQVDDVVLDIGANDGTFLRACQPEVPVRRVGFEPADNVVPMTAYEQIPDFFSAASYWQYCDRPARLITSIAMFYDLDDPVAFAREVQEVLADDGVWVVEVQNAERLLIDGIYDTVLHEHLVYYTPGTLVDTLQRAGLVVTKLERSMSNGGSLRAYVRHTGRSVQVDSLSPLCLSQGLAHRVRYQQARLRDLLEGYAARGQSVYGYGASTKGAVVLQACGIDQRLCQVIADKDPAKWGQHMPGSGIPICSEEAMRASQPDALLVLPWAFADTFLAREQALFEAGTDFLIPFPLPAVRHQTPRPLNKEIPCAL
jgi:NDP-4-keto-2,6-dideoxyhexose 3-C-methyltransferase